MSDDTNFIEGIQFYFENGLIVLTENYHLQRGYCCGNGCRHCPYNYENIADEKKGTAKKRHSSSSEENSKKHLQ